MWTYAINYQRFAMKRLVFVLYCFACATLSVAGDGFVRITGTATGAQAPEKILLMDADNGRPIEYASTSVSEENTFGFLLKPAANKPFYYLSDGNRFFRIAPSDTTTISVSWHDGAFSFVRVGNAKNKFLQQWNRLSSMLVKKPGDAYAAFFARFDSVRTEAKRLLQQITDPTFSPCATDVVETDLLYAFISYLQKNQQTYDSEEQTSAYYQDIMRSFPETSARLLYLPYGLNLMNAYFSYKQTYVCRNQEYGMDEQLKELHDPKLCEAYILGNIPTEGYERYIDYETKYLPLLSDRGQRMMRNNMPRPTFKMTAGEKAPNLIYPDADGKLHALSSLRGNYVYVDLWATWCAPCKAEIPHLQKIEQKYRGYNIRFVSISIDKDKEKWLQYINRHQLCGVQLWAGNWDMLPKEMNIGSIPRFLLIDPEGNWVSSNAYRPSNPALDKLLERLLKNTSDR